MKAEVSFFGDVVRYARQVEQFDTKDWMVYVAWVGLMFGLVASTSGFLAVGYFAGVVYPAYVWSIPIGCAIFVGAISFDTIGHRTAYKEVLKKGEALVHHITIFAGITSCLLLSLGFHWPEFLFFPIVAFIALSIVYSLIDEALHWHRYLNHNSDRVEMWSHFFIFVGHTIFILAWFHWFSEGYPGVQATLDAMASLRG